MATLNAFVLKPLKKPTLKICIDCCISSAGGKAAGAWSWPLAPNQCQCKNVWFDVSASPHVFMMCLVRQRGSFVFCVLLVQSATSTGESAVIFTWRENQTSDILICRMSVTISLVSSRFGGRDFFANFVFRTVMNTVILLHSSKCLSACHRGGPGSAPRLGTMWFVVAKLVLRQVFRRQYHSTTAAYSLVFRGNRQGAR